MQGNAIFHTLYKNYTNGVSKYMAHLLHCECCSHSSDARLAVLLLHYNRIMFVEQDCVQKLTFETSEDQINTALELAFSLWSLTRLLSISKVLKEQFTQK